jgi:hypothetical protein
MTGGIVATIFLMGLYQMVLTFSVSKTLYSVVMDVSASIPFKRDKNGPFQLSIFPRIYGKT